MDDQDKTKGQLIAELVEMRQREAQWRGAFADEKVEEEVEVTVKGERRVCSNVIAPVREDGRTRGILAVNVDSTERKRAEEALRESERKLSTLISSLPGMAYRCRNEIKWSMTFVSDGCLQLTGYRRSELLDGGVVAYGDLIHLEDRQTVWNQVKEALGKRQHFQLEYRIRTAAGEEKWVWEQGVGVFSDDGQVKALEGFITDITDTKKAELALRLSEAKYRRLHQSMMDAFVSVDMNGYIREYNEAYRKMLGYEPAELLTLRYTDLTPEKWHRFEAEIVQAQILPFGYSDTYEKEYRRKDGTIFPVELRTFLIADDDAQPRAMWAIVRDITDRKRAESALQKAHDELEEKVEERTAELAQANQQLKNEIEVRRRAEELLGQSERKFRNYFEQGLIGMAATAPDGRWLEVNDRLCGILGYPREELLEKTWDELTHADDLAIDLHQFQRLLSGEIQHYALDKRFIRRDGATVYTTIHIRAFQGEDGSIDHIVGLMEDITARKRAEESLKESETKLKTLFEILPAGVSILDEHRNIVDANPTLGQILGLSRERLLRGDYIHRKYLRGDGSPMPFEEFPSVRAMAEEMAVSGVEVGVVKEDGTTAWTSVSATPLRIRGLGAAVVTTDITAQKRAEETLRQSHDELQAIYEQVVDGIIIVDPETVNPVRTNAAFRRMLGYSEEEATTVSPVKVHPPEALPMVWEHLETVKRGLVARIDNLPFLRKDGNIFYADVVSSPIHYNKQPCWISFFRDITERKRAAEALVESEAKYRQLVEITDTGYAILDAQGRVADANDEYIRLSGHRALKEILGRSVVEWTASYDLERNAQEVKKCLEQEKVRQLEVDYVRPDGGVIPIEINASCIDTQQGRRILALHRDISERRQAQAALEREQQTLKHLLQSSDHERQLIAYEIHDGLAQYLAGSLMQFEVYAHLKETKPKDAAKAYDAGMTMLRQSHADARRLISGVRPPILDEEGITAALTHLVNDHRREKGPKIELLNRVEFDRLVPILENAIYRIAQEALTNACRHSKSKRIQVELAQHGDVLRLKVQDWGVGFNPGEVEENRFGLAGMRERARLLGGSIRVQSTPGKGTRIAVKLPLMVRE